MYVTLETERLLLRPFQREDAPAMFEGWTSDPEVTKYLTWNTHQTLEETQYVLDLWLKEYEQPNRLNFAILLKEEQRVIGGIDIVRYEDGVPVIGYNLSRKYWNHGYMTEACRCVLDYLFGQGYSAVRIDAMVDNIGSNRVIQKCGGTLVNTTESVCSLKNDTVTVHQYIVKK